MIKSGEAKKIMGGDDNQSEILLLPIKTLVGLIGKLTPEMFQIACNMPDQKPKEDDDVPF